MMVNWLLVRRARASARGEFCFARNRKVATLAWELKWSLSGDRLGSGVNIGLATCRSIGSASDARARARASARGESCTARNRKVAVLAWKLKWPLRGDRVDFGVNMGPVTCWSIGSASDARAVARVRAC